MRPIPIEPVKILRHSAPLNLGRYGTSRTTQTYAQMLEIDRRREVGGDAQDDAAAELEDHDDAADEQDLLEDGDRRGDVVADARHEVAERDAPQGVERDRERRDHDAEEELEFDDAYAKCAMSATIGITSTLRQTRSPRVWPRISLCALRRARDLPPCQGVEAEVGEEGGRRDERQGDDELAVPRRRRAASS